MAKIKTIGLVFANNRQIDIPIWSKKAEAREKCHIDRISNNDDIRKIKLYFYDDETRVYDVLDTHIRKCYRKRK